MTEPKALTIAAAVRAVREQRDAAAGVVTACDKIDQARRAGLGVAELFVDEHEVVFSGRGFRDGRGLSSAMGSSSLAGVSGVSGRAVKPNSEIRRA